MHPDQILSRLAVSLAIGLLVGLERGWRTRDEREHQRAAGLRTFALAGLTGGATGVLALDFGGLVIGIVFCGFALVFAAFQWLESRLDRNVSATSAVAGMLVFLLGALAVTGPLVPAVAAAVAMTLLLAAREHLHRWVAALTGSKNALKGVGFFQHRGRDRRTCQQHRGHPLDSGRARGRLSNLIPS